MNIKIVEIHDLHRKQYWYEKFCRGYEGQTRQFNEQLIISDARFFVAMRGTKKLGFIRINDKSAYFDCCVWNASEAYVKPVYRSNGVLRDLIKHVIMYCNVKMLHISANNYFENLSYYESLGFTKFLASEQFGIGWVFLCDFEVDLYRKQPAGNNDNQTVDAVAVA